jgi:hypothetical protein
MADSQPIRATARRPAERRTAEPRAEMPVEVFLDLFPAPMREIAIRLREIVRRELPDAEERVRLHWKLLGYHLPLGRRGAFVAWVALEPRHVHLGFPMGVLIDDPDGNLRGRGITKLARWLTYRTIDEVDAEVAVGLIRAARAVAHLPRSAAG